MFAAFNIFWSALVLPLSAPPYGFSHTVISAFGLVGVAGALAASHAGRWADRGYAQHTSAFALVTLLLAWWPLPLMDTSLWPLVVGIVLLDLAGQALHVTNQSLIFRVRPEAHSRLVALYMLFYALGSGMGAFSTTLTDTHAGWQGGLAGRGGQPAGVVVMGDNAQGCYIRIKNGPRMRAVADDSGWRVTA